MESTGDRDRIQCTQETADLLVAAGKERWLERRQETVHAKGKGQMQTYWLDSGSSTGKGKPSMVIDPKTQEHAASGTVQRMTLDELTAEKSQRLIDWNAEVLLRLLKQIVAKRVAKQSPGSLQQLNEKKFLLDQKEAGKTVIDEVREIVNLPGYRSRSVVDEEAAQLVTLPDQVVKQLRDYITNIAALYNSNPFHNFEHASHVTMSVTKLLSRIAAPAEIEFETSLAETGKALHDHTYGITSDPLTQFACVYSALIHDGTWQLRRMLVMFASSLADCRLTIPRPALLTVDQHPLVKENASIAEYYNNQSPAEQNSVDLAWSLLMHSDYNDLRRTIYCTEGELRRFRQLVVNSVMATDIVDKDLKTLRNARWSKAFSVESPKRGDKDVLFE
jgi:3'5'-cyclic nucleotide phosphodiesterase